MFPTGWGRRCSITIDYTKIPGSLTDFPVLLTKDTLPSEMFDADGSYPALNGGGDIRFSSDSAGATQLACEIVSFVTDNNPANGSAEIWVKVPSVSSSANTVIYVWYNKAGESQPAVTDTYGRNNVWDSNFKMVQHLKDATTSTTTDSTSNGNNGSKKAASEPVEATGKIEKGQNFDGNDDYVQIADANSLDFTSEITIEAWINGDSFTTGTGNGIIAKSAFDSSHGAFFLALIGTTPVKWGFGLNNGIGEIYNNTPSTGTWYYVVARYKKNTNWNIYANNSSVASGTAPNTDIAADANNIRIAQYYSATTRTFDGVIDEVKLSNVYRSNDWIGASYNNQNAPSTFATEGTPESTSTTYTQAMNYTATAVVAISKIFIAVKSLAPTVAVVTTISRLATLYKGLSATATGETALLKGLVSLMSMAVTATAVVANDFFYLMGKALSATATAVVSMSQLKTFYRTLSAVPLAVVSVTKALMTFVGLSVEAVAVVTRTSALSLFKSLSVVGIGITAVGRLLVGLGIGFILGKRGNTNTISGTAKKD